MTSDPTQFVGDIPESYDRGLGPHIFEPYAADLAARVAAFRPARVLEIAAGTGIVTRKLRDALPESSTLTASDLNAPMLDVARAKFSPQERVAFETADAMALPFDEGAFDAVACQFGVMFFPDKPQAYREARRVLAPGGRYLFNVWDSRANNPFARIAHDVISGFFPADPPQFYAVPFSYNDADEMRRALVDAGFVCDAIEIVKFEQPFDAASFARGLVHGNPVIAEIRTKTTTEPDVIVGALSNALAREFPSGIMPLRAIVSTGRKS